MNLQQSELETTKAELTTTRAELGATKAELQRVQQEFGKDHMVLQFEVEELRRRMQLEDCFTQEVAMLY